MSRSQPATFNETWSDDRVFAYLNHLPTKGENADFAVLYQAYKHMRTNDFERLLTKFVADGRDVNAKNQQGERIHDVVNKHVSFASEFNQVLAKFS